jgi:hypothetical protein
MPGACLSLTEQVQSSAWFFFTTFRTRQQQEGRGGAEEMPNRCKCLLYKCEDLSSNAQNSVKSRWIEQFAWKPCAPMGRQKIKIEEAPGPASQLCAVVSYKREEKKKHVDGKKEKRSKSKGQRHMLFIQPKEKKNSSAQNGKNAFLYSSIFHIILEHYL